jgi:hypothetical protein
MRLERENLIHWNHGKIFGTNASSDVEMEEIKSAVERVDGVLNVKIVQGVYPREFIVHTSKIVKVIDVENAVRGTHLHAIPKGFFGL